jgi:DNA-binding SARP family transcriptional activator
MSGTCRVSVLGGFAVEVNGRDVPVSAWHHEADRLVKLLALEPSHRLAPSRVTARLWPRLDARAAAKRLSHAVKAACKAMGSRSGVTLDADQVQLWPAGSLDVDLLRFEVAARRASSQRGSREAVDLYPGELLPDDHDEQWTEPARRQARDAYLRHLAKCGQLPGVIDLDHAQSVLSELQALRPR